MSGLPPLLPSLPGSSLPSLPVSFILPSLLNPLLTSHSSPSLSHPSLWPPLSMTSESARDLLPSLSPSLVVVVRGGPSVPSHPGSLSLTLTLTHYPPPTPAARTRLLSPLARLLVHPPALRPLALGSTLSLSLALSGACLARCECVRGRHSGTSSQSEGRCEWSCSQYRRDKTKSLSCPRSGFGLVLHPSVRQVMCL